MLTSEMINKWWSKNDLPNPLHKPKKKIFGQNVAKVVRLTENADIALLHQNVAQFAT